MSPAQPPRGWPTWEGGGGVRVAAPAELRPQPTPGISILRAEHGGARYQVTVATDPPGVTVPDQPAEFFEAFLDSFASSGGFRRDGPTERLRVEGHPAAQARFRGGDLNAVVRVVCRGDRTVSLAVLAAGSVDEADPEGGGFLNSLQVGERGQ